MFILSSSISFPFPFVGGLYVCFFHYYICILCSFLSGFRQTSSVSLISFSEANATTLRIIVVRMDIFYFNVDYLFCPFPLHRYICVVWYGNVIWWFHLATAMMRKIYSILFGFHWFVCPQAHFYSPSSSIPFLSLSLSRSRAPSTIHFRLTQAPNYMAFYGRYNSQK